MAKCWSCGLPVKSGVRRMDCRQCRGSIVTDEERALEARERNRKEWEALMSHDAHKRSRRAIRQIRHGSR